MLGSCAKVEEPTVDELQAVSLKEWIGLYGEGAEAYPNGMYIKKLVNSSKPNAKKPVANCWIKINYTSRTLDGDVFATRDADVAMEQGTFKAYTHYAPEYLGFYVGSGYYTELPLGEYDALSMMEEGDIWRVYLPSRLAYGGYGTVYGQGYHGQHPLGADIPVVIDLELVEVVPFPLSHEEDLVMAYAMNNFGQQPRDSLASGIYIHSLGDMGDTATVRYQSEMTTDKITEVYYTVRFMDGFVFDTNIEDTARKYNFYTPSNSYDPLEVRVSGYVNNDIDENEESVYIEGFYKALLGMKYGQTARAVFTSSLGYGSSGNGYGNVSTIIDPYTPLVYDLFAISRGGDGQEDLPVFVAGVIDYNGSMLNAWVSGYVVGVTEGEVSDARFEGPFTTKTNLILADSPSEKKTSKVIAVELPAGAVQDALNLVDNASLLGQRIKVRGNILPYLGANGVEGVFDYRLP